MVRNACSSAGVFGCRDINLNVSGCVGVLLGVSGGVCVCALSYYTPWHHYSGGGGGGHPGDMQDWGGRVGSGEGREGRVSESQSSKHLAGWEEPRSCIQVGL